MASKRFSSGLVTLCLAIILPCLALSSILELALKNGSPRRPDGWTPDSPPERRALTKRDTRTDWWPKDMFPNEEGILNASAALALLAAFMMSVLAIIALRKGTVGTTKMRLAILAILGLNLFLATAAFLFAFIQSRVSSRVDPDYIRDNLKNGEMTFYEKGRFTHEMWACGFVPLDAIDFDPSVLEKVCAMNLGARWLTFTTFLFSAALFVVALFDSRREGHIVYAV